MVVILRLWPPKSIIGHVFLTAAGQAPAEIVQGQLAISTDELIKFLQNMLRERKGIAEDAEF